MIVVADKKTPPIESFEGCTVLTVEAQRDLGFKSLAHTPYNHYCRKNVGYLYALSQGAEFVYDADDDNLPYPEWGLPAWQCSQRLAQEAGFVNVYRHFTGDWIWPRGFPLDLVRQSLASRPTAEQLKDEMEVGAWCGVVDGDADVDAIYRLVVGHPVQFDGQAPPVVLGPGHWCPFNSQNTFWRRRSALALYLPVTVTFRFTDILRGYVAQRLFWEWGLALGFLPPVAYQDRNPHDLMMDFSDEYPLYLQTRELVHALEKTRLQPNDDLGNMVRIYEVLEALQIVRTADVHGVRAWAEDLASFGFEEMRTSLKDSAGAHASA
jgi:hypothetical protein